MPERAIGSANQYPLELGAALLTTIPVAASFVIFQRYLGRARLEGSLKE